MLRLRIPVIRHILYTPYRSPLRGKSERDWDQWMSSVHGVGGGDDGTYSAKSMQGTSGNAPMAGSLPDGNLGDLESLSLVVFRVGIELVVGVGGRRCVVLYRGVIWKRIITAKTISQIDGSIISPSRQSRGSSPSVLRYYGAQTA